MHRTHDYHRHMSDRADLSFFTVLARKPSLAAAAQELGLSPPAVSRRLAALETHLGVRLLNRTTRRLSLTPEGERYLEEGERILREIAALERSLTASTAQPHGLLRINATFGFGRRHLAPAVSEFVRLHPQVEVVLDLTDRPLDLTAHAIDIGRSRPTAACCAPRLPTSRHMANRRSHGICRRTNASSSEKTRTRSTNGRCQMGASN